MERLSDKAIELINDMHTERLNYDGEYLPLIDAAQRLAEYEDTGLTPEEVEIQRETKADAQFMLTELCRLCDYDRLEELARADQEGKLVVIPCKVGDILYYFPEWYARSGYEPTPISVEEVNSFSGSVVVECYMDPDTRLSFLPADFGKTVFLTLEEAEAALVTDINVGHITEEAAQ